MHKAVVHHCSDMIMKQDMKKFIHDFDPMLKCIDLMTFENNNPISFEKFVKSLVDNY